MLQIRRALVMSMVVGLAACGDGTGPKPEANVDSLLAEVARAESFSGYGASLGGAPVGPAPSYGTGACAYTASSQSFVCPPLNTPSGITLSRSYQLLDAAGAPQSAFNAATTAAIRTVGSMSGTVTMQGTQGAPAMTMTVASNTDQTLSGLLSTAKTLNGTGSSTSTMTQSGTALTFTTSQTTENLVLPVRGGAPYPASGRITVVVTGPAGIGGGTRTATIVQTYNGTSIVTMTMTTGAVTTTCTFDMAQPSRPPNCSGG